MKTLTFDSQIDCLEYSSTSNLLAIGTSHITGEVWNGALIVTEQKKEEFQEKKRYQTFAGITSAAWVSPKEEIIAAGSDDSCIQLFALMNKKDKSLRSLVEHDDIVTSVSSHKADRDLVLSAGWDKSIKLWPPRSTSASQTFSGHLDLIWDVEWNPKIRDVFASVSQDCSLRIWDQRSSRTTQRIDAVGALYCLSWSPLNQNLIAIGGDDFKVKVYDTRNIAKEVFLDQTHTAAVRRLKFSPHTEETLASSSDDSTISLLNTKTNSAKRFTHHKDFVRALAWNSQTPSLLTSGSWDGTVCLFNINE